MVPVAFALGLAALVAASLGACRQGQPDGAPKMPPNSPVPEIDRPEEPTPPPKITSDAGAMSSGAARYAQTRDVVRTERR